MGYAVARPNLSTLAWAMGDADHHQSFLSAGVDDTKVSSLLSTGRALDVLCKQYLGRGSVSFAALLRV